MTRRTISLVLASVTACVTSAAAATTGFDPSGDPVFQKLLHFNSGLKSYTAHVDVETRMFFGRFTLHGTLYNWGNASKVVFDNVPMLAKGAVDHQPSIEAPAQWADRYSIAPVAQTPQRTTYRLVPLEPGSLREVEVTVANETGLIMEYVWSTSSGVTITSDQSYESLDGYELVASTVTETRGGGLHTHSTTKFTNYALNGTIPDSIVSSTR
jgi:hypothetical protein